ncbi:YveK family protein [Alicyclobacillus sp. SO9]|uniref:YveK family protein n=1 Tax=Alicyclobacillus sp. SO9 TaxID=2665646 RepID=UPI0018E83A03|nr:Wzz/FepE/Etk N-terminal domain-containing protein [Alicyclobacillus sp. SO9]QQE78728.1 capsular biosynthesis protein [Alicyclobacillus sp. SO9]
MEELELRQYWNIIRKRMKLVVSIPIIALIISGVFSYFVITPKYEASSTLLVNERSSQANNIQISAIDASQALVKTYTQIIKSATVENAVKADLGLNLTAAQLGSMIAVSSPNQSQVIQVSVTSPNVKQAVRIANSVAAVTQHETTKIMHSNNVQILDKATLPANPSPVKPNKKLNLAIALVLGLMVSIGLAFLLEYLDTRIKSEEDVDRYLKLPVLGTIMDYENEV